MNGLAGVRYVVDEGGAGDVGGDVGGEEDGGACSPEGKLAGLV